MNETQHAKSIQMKNGWIVLLGLSVLLLIIYFYITYQTKIPEIPKNVSRFVSPIENLENESVILEKSQREIIELAKRNSMLEKELNEQKNQQLLREAEFNRRFEQLEMDNSASRPISRDIEDNENVVEEVDTSIQEIKLTLSKKNNVPVKPSKNIDNYVPAGSFVKAVMIGGADASAAVQSQALLSPMLFRIIEDGTLPNHQRSHLKDCVVTGAVFGDISSERGLIRTEQLSCVFPHGQILDTKVDGTIFGPEGKNGVRGNPVWRENVLLQRAFAAGALSGLAEGITTSYSTQSISPEGVVSSIKNGKVFQAAGAKGVGRAMEKLADYNIQRAEQYHPVIQLSAGTIVDIVFIKGFYLEEETKNSSIENDEQKLFVKSSHNSLDGSLQEQFYQDLKGE